MRTATWMRGFVLGAGLLVAGMGVASADIAPDAPSAPHDAGSGSGSATAKKDDGGCAAMRSSPADAVVGLFALGAAVLIGTRKRRREEPMARLLSKA